jgi:hypothetical protein
VISPDLFQSRRANELTGFWFLDLQKKRPANRNASLVAASGA